MSTLLFCASCLDLVALCVHDIVRCACGRSMGRLRADGTAWLRGEQAFAATVLRDDLRRAAEWVDRLDGKMEPGATGPTIATTMLYRNDPALRPRRT